MRYTMLTTVLLAVITLTAATAETVVLAPSQTASITGEVDGLNDSRLLIAFDISGIPKEAIIFYGALRLYDDSGLPWKNSYVPVVVAPLTEEWDASSASWDGSSADWNPKRIAYRVLMTKARTPAKFVVTNVVKEWARGELANYGLIAMIQDVADLQDMTNLFNDETLKPSLEIRYVLPPNDRP